MKLLLAPRWVRRLVVIPALLVGMVFVLSLLPLWLIVAACASRFVPGRWRILRLFWFFVVYLALEVLVLVALAGLWIAAGFGTSVRSEASQARHYALMAWFLARIMGAARRTFGVRFSYDEPEGAQARPDRPVLVFSRHAGPGDSIILVDGVLNGAHRRPRIVLKDLLQLDPAIDVALNRLPNRFVPSGGRAGQSVVEAIADLAATTAGDDALVLFPEGGNFTPGRRQHAIEVLEGIGREDLAQRARDLEHLLPPKPTGALAAIAAAPDADVVFVGHFGLERLSTLRDIWRALPMDNEVLIRTWFVRCEDIPPDVDRELWLYDHWELIDSWIDECLEREALGQNAPGQNAPGQNAPGAA